MSAPLKIAAVGVGRIGIYHALHVQELANREGTCELTAIVDGHEDLAERVAAQLQPGQETEIRTFTSVDELAEAGPADASVIASRTADHFREARTLIDAGQRILLEKPLTHSLETSHEFVAWLDGDGRRRQALMLAFMRRFDAPLLRARELLAERRIGKVFKIVSILEDPHGPPEGYSSPGLLIDMGVHNADEVIWLTGKVPRSVTGMGARLHNQKVSSVAEDFDDVFIQMWLEEDAIAQVQVGRNHVAGYRNETCVYGDEGVIQVGHFQENPLEVRFEAYGRGSVIDRQVFRMRDYGREVPVFIERFGPAYSAEIAHFVEQCRNGGSFSVDQRDGLRAQTVVDAGKRSLLGAGDAVAIDL